MATQVASYMYGTAHHVTVGRQHISEPVRCDAYAMPPTFSILKALCRTANDLVDNNRLMANSVPSQL